MKLTGIRGATYLKVEDSSICTAICNHPYIRNSNVNQRLEKDSYPRELDEINEIHNVIEFGFLLLELNKIR